MKNENKYMYVCRKCKQTYSSNLNYDRDCPDCNNRLERMPISRQEWITLLDTEKENYKNAFLSQVKKVTDKKYIYKSATPLAWHKYNVYFRVPFSFISVFINFNTGNINIFAIFQSVLLLLFSIGAYSWKKYAWFCIIMADVNYILTALINCTVVGFDTYFWHFLGAFIASSLEIYYYIKRKALFNGTKEDPVEIFDFKSDHSISQDNNLNNFNKENDMGEVTSNFSKIKTKNDIKFCKNCGVELKENAEFCHNCGEKIG